MNEVIPGKFIEGKELTAENVGDKVTYVAPHHNGDASKGQGGRIKRWTHNGVFVDFGHNVCFCNFVNLVWG